MTKSFLVVVIVFLFGCSNDRGNPSLVWQKMSSPLASSIRSLAQTADSILYVATTSGVFKSDDGGKRWQSSGLEGKVIDKIIATRSGSLLAGVYRSGLYRSDDKGKNWTLIGFSRNVYIYSILQNDDQQLFLSASFISEGNPSNTPTGVFKSSDDGKTWQHTSFIKNDVINLSQPKKGLLFVSTKGETHISKNDGKNWTIGGIGLPNSIPISGIISFNNSLYASVGDRQEETGAIRGGIYRSDDEGMTWSPSDNGIDERSPISSICLQDSILYASAGFEQKTGYNGIYRSGDKGRSWVKHALNGSASRFVTELLNGRIAVGTNGQSLFISGKGGNDFMQCGAGINNWETFRITGSKHGLYASGNGIWSYSFVNRSWSIIRKSSSIDVAAVSNGRLLVFENNQILASENKGQSWYQTMAISGDYAIFKVLDEKLLVANIANNGSWYSTDQGLTWEKYKIIGFENASIRTAVLTKKGTLLLSGTNDSPVTLRSSNHGQTFQRVKQLDSLEVWDFASFNGIILAGTYAHGIFKSLDDGITWSASNNGLKINNEYVTVSSITTVNEQTIICSTLGKGMFISRDAGNNWEDYNRGITDENLWTSFYDPIHKTVFAAGPSGIYQKKPK